MAKKQIPKCTIIPGLLLGIDYEELIKRDSSIICESVDVSKNLKVKTKIYSINRNKKNKI